MSEDKDKISNQGNFKKGMRTFQSLDKRLEKLEKRLEKHEATADRLLEVVEEDLVPALGDLAEQVELLREMMEKNGVGNIEDIIRRVLG